MTFFSILFALLIEQFKPLRADNPVYGIVKALARQMERWFNAGEAAHGRVAWFVMMTLLLLPALLLYWLCASISPFAVLALNILIVYLTLGFRHYSHYFTSIQLALGSRDDAEARRLLAEWTRQETVDLDVSNLSRLAVETALVSAHRNVFGVFFWFLMPFGPVGAILYRVSEYLARAWNEPEHLRQEEFGQFAARAFYWIDWMPSRLTAIAFAIVGNFEDAIYAWRNFASRWQDEAVGIILSAGGGAMGLRLGASVQKAGDMVLLGDALGFDDTGLGPDLPPGEEATSRALQSAVGLVWRALLLWMLLLLLISIAVWLG
jgi:adenosylcobinamide-phosphate synthase